MGLKSKVLVLLFDTRYGQIRGSDLTIEIESVNKLNWEEAIAIEVEESQKKFVPSVAISLAEAYVEPFDEKIDAYVVKYLDKVIGFFLVSYPYTNRSYYWISGLVIDFAFQKRGFGKKALLAFIEKCRLEEDIEFIGLVVNPENPVATKIYRQLGFKETGKKHEDGDVVMKLNLL